MEERYRDEVQDLFEQTDPGPFVYGGDSRATSPDSDHSPIRTYADKGGMTLSAISDRRFMAWIVAALMPLAGRRVFEIGTGSGYLAYALAQLTGPDGLVAGCEVIPELTEASTSNALIRSFPWIQIHAGDFVEIIPELGQFDIVIATSSMSILHATILNACKPDGGMIAVPIEIQGGGDCYTIFRRQGRVLEPLDAMLSVSVPTTGRYSPDPAWAVPVQQLVPDFDVSRAVRIMRADDLGHPVYGTLALRSFLQAHEPLFAAVSLAADQCSFAQNIAFGLVDRRAESFCFQHGDQLLLGGDRALALAERLAQRREEWEASGRASLADYQYLLEIEGGCGIAFAPAIAARSSAWRRR